ncbi:MAG: type 1 glutamine amidotransferase domain-containing protein [Pirellulales bacterium]
MIVQESRAVFLPAEYRCPAVWSIVRSQCFHDLSDLIGAQHADHRFGGAKSIWTIGQSVLYAIESAAMRSASQLQRAIDRKTIMTKKILIIVSNTGFIGPRNRRTGIFLPEVAHPYAEFDRAGYQIDFASLTGEGPFLDALNLADDPDNLSFLVGKGWAAMQKAKKLADVDVRQYDAIFVPGGLAPMADMPDHPLLKKVIQETFERNAVVGAVCHGPVSLLNVKLSDGKYIVDGKDITSFTNDEEENYAKADVPFELETALTGQGAIFHQVAPWQPNSLADGNLVTGQNPASAKGVAEKMIARLAAK